MHPSIQKNLHSSFVLYQTILAFYQVYKRKYQNWILSKYKHIYHEHIFILPPFQIISRFNFFGSFILLYIWHIIYLDA
jgi:hypothetical protein